MSDPFELRYVVLDRLPAVSFAAAVTYLADILRECQLVLVGRNQGALTDPTLAQLAEGLVPDIEEIRDVFEAGSLTTNDDGSTCLVAPIEVGQAGTLAHLQMQLIQLRLLGRRGGLLVRSEPDVSQLLAWIWDEASDQIHGRPARPYHPAT